MEGRPADQKGVRGRQRGREANKQTGRQTHTLADKEIFRHPGLHIYIWVCRQI